MKIELKKFSFSERMSEETNAFTADVFVDGVKVAAAKNYGHGGNTDYHAYPGQESLLKKVEDYCKGLPKHTYPAMYEGDKPLTVDMDLETMIDNLVDEQLKLKEQKKMEKKFVNSVCWGVPGANSYSQVKFKVPLSQIPTAKLQEYVDKYKKEFKTGEQFLNNNFASLNIK